jgi:hypothetical protein
MIFRKRTLIVWLLTLLALAAKRPSVIAQSRVFSISGTNAVMEDVSSEVQVLFRALRFNDVSEQWNVDLSVTNSGNRRFGPTIVVSIESALNTTGPLQTDGLAGAPPKPFILVGQPYFKGDNFLPGTASSPRTISMDYVDGVGAPKLETKVFAQPLDASPAFALAIARSLNGVGQPLTGVTVSETGPIGQRTLTTDPAYGVVTLGQGIGDHVWIFSRPDYLPVWRRGTLTGKNVDVIANPRLASRGTNSTTITTSGGQLQDSTGAVQIQASANALPPSSTMTLTVIDGQTLPGVLPLGWSPLRAFWFEADAQLTQPVSALLRPDGGVQRSDSTALAYWNETNASWEVAQTLTGSGSTAVAATLSRTGAFAWVVADTGVLAPPLPQLGHALQPTAVGLVDASSLTAAGSVNPATSLASRVPEEVTGTASLTITSSSGPLPSGLLLRCELSEDYQLQDNSRRFTSTYENFITGYQRPGDSDPKTLQAVFPIRPLILLGSDQLSEATVRADVLTPTAFTGGVFETNGNTIGIEGVQLTAHAGDFASRQAALIRALTPTNFQSLVADNSFSIAAAVDLTVAAVVPGHSLSLQVTNLPTNGVFVLTRVLSDAGFAGLEPIERFQTDTNGSLSTLEISSSGRLPGLTQAGQYLLLSVTAPQGLISGVALNAAGQPAGGLPVRVAGKRPKFPKRVSKNHEKGLAASGKTAHPRPRCGSPAAHPPHHGRMIPADLQRASKTFNCATTSPAPVASATANKPTPAHPHVPGVPATVHTRSRFC